MLKNAYFLEKTAKLFSASGAPPPDLRIVTSSYYYSFIKFISRGKCILLPLKKNKITTVNVLFLFLLHFFTYFLLQTLYFLLTGGARIFLAPGRRVP